MRRSETADSTERRRKCRRGPFLPFASMASGKRSAATITSRLHKSSFTVSLCTAAFSPVSIKLGSILVYVSLSPVPPCHWDDVAYLSPRRQLSCPAGVPEPMAHDTVGIWEIPQSRGTRPCGWVAWRCGCRMWPSNEPISSPAIRAPVSPKFN